MSDQSVTCRYIFTGKQHGRAIACYWRSARVKWFVLFCMLVVLFGTVYGEMNPGESGPPQTVTALSILLDFLPIVGFFGILFFAIWVYGKFAFRRTAFFNKELTYTLDESGIHVRSPVMNSDVDWAIYGRAAENSDGFAVFMKGGGSFSWLPKDGFDGEENIDRCRELLRRSIKKSKLSAS